MRQQLPQQRARLIFSSPSWSISRCCGNHPILAARIEIKEWVCFCWKSLKIWAWIARCSNIRNQNGQEHIRHVGLQLVITMFHTPKFNKSLKLYQEWCYELVITSVPYPWVFNKSEKLYQERHYELVVTSVPYPWVFNKSLKLYQERHYELVVTSVPYPWTFWFGCE